MQLRTQRNCVTEIHFRAAGHYADPYNEVDLDLICTGPDGSARRVPAFWAGDNVWKARLAADRLGRHAFRTECSRPDDAGLHGQEGSLEVEAYTGANPLLAHGRLRIAADRRHFEHADGTPFFWLGDTWWMGFTTRLPWPDGFRELAADRIAKGFNVIQIIAGPYPDMDAWDARGRNEAGFPFTEDFAGINPAYYDHADLKIAELVHTGLMPCIVGMWGYYLPRIGVDRIKRFWRHLVARYGAYPVVWCACGEVNMAYYLSETKEADIAAQRTGWTEVMAWIRQTDGHGNLITVHPPTGSGRDGVEDDSVMDFEMLQTGHGDLASVGPTRAMVRHAVAREPRMPVINSEVNYEGILGYAWQNVQRLCFYNTVLSGAAGHTYGANGIWQLNCTEQPYGPSPHGRAWGDTPWNEAMHLPGSRQVGRGAQLLRRLPWWELERRSDWLDSSPNENDPYDQFAVGIPRRLRLIYGGHTWWEPPPVKGIEPDVAYRACYFDPCTGREHPAGDVTPDGDGVWKPPIPPACHDWVLVLEAT